MSRYYKITRNGKEIKLPSCTTIISDCTNLSSPLTQWAANMVVQWIKENCLNPIIDDYGKKADWYEVEIGELEDARFHFREVSQKALDIGSEVHDMIENYLKDERIVFAEDTPDEVQSAFQAFRKWEKENDLKPIKIEQAVYGDKWAGTLDFYGYFNDKLYVIDWKSSKAHYPEMRYQVAAYRNAKEKELYEEAKVRYNDFLFDTLPTGCGVLRLDKETGLPDFKDHSKTYKQDLKVFNCMVDLYYERHPRIRKQFEEATK